MKVHELNLLIFTLVFFFELCIYIYYIHLDFLHLFSPPIQRPTTNPFQQKLCSLCCFLPEINPPLP